MLGEACALAAALTWAVSLILFKRSEAVSPLAMNLFKNSVASVLLFLSLPLSDGSFFAARSNEDWVRIVVSGVFGIAICDVLVFMALRRLGASLLAVVDCCYAPVIVLLSLAVLGEEPAGWSFGLGALLVVGGVVLATTERPPPDAAAVADGSRAAGILMGITGIVFMGVGVVIVKPVLETSGLVEVTLLRLLAGLAAQLLWVAAIPSQREAVSVFAYRNRAVWKTLLPASVLGSYVAMLFWLGGFKWAEASVASVLNQMAAVFTLVLARIFLGEHLSLRRAAGGAAAVGGAALILATSG